jgi:Putative prokaryotic signal transducing protein
MAGPAAMKRVLSGNSLPDTAHFKNLLEQSGIACVIKNRELGGGLGDLPVFDCAPEIWVADEYASRAELLIRDSVRPARGAPWRCTACGEDSEPQFAACWSCGSADGRGGEPA